MRRLRSERELDELVNLARACCEAFVAYRDAKARNSLTPCEEEAALRHIGNLDARLGMLKSNSELDRCRALPMNVIQLGEYRWKTAR